jgi:chromate transporter
MGVDFAQALRVWFKIGCLGFGGPAGQIALMHRILVDEKKWVEESRYLHALNFCMLLPGPEAQKLATYVGWLLHGTRGGLVAGILFVLPGALVMLGVSLLYPLGQGIPAVDGALFGVKAAVLVIVVSRLA